MAEWWEGGGGALRSCFFYRYVLDEGDVGIMLIYLVTLDRYDYGRNEMKTLENRYIAT